MNELALFAGAGGGSLAATERHLEDMRTIVFKKIMKEEACKHEQEKSESQACWECPRPVTQYQNYEPR